MERHILFVELMLMGMIFVGLIVVFAMKHLIIALAITVAIAIIYFSVRICYIRKKKNKGTSSDCLPDFCPMECFNASDVCDGDCNPFN